MIPRRFRQHPRAAEGFGLAVLEAIATKPGLEVVQRTLVLKGGAALLHVHGSGRATRTDLDFDVRTDEAITEAHINRLLAELREPWGAAYGTGERPGKFEAHEDRINIGPIAFRGAGNQIGTLMLQISRRQVPPRMHDFIADHDLIGSTGTQFKFPIMPLEVIAAEKAFRSVTIKGPHLTDEYDIGYILEKLANLGPIPRLFEEICADERWQIARDWNDGKLRDNYNQADRARTSADLFIDDRVLDEDIPLEDAKSRVKVGVAYVRELAGLPPVPTTGKNKAKGP